MEDCRAALLRALAVARPTEAARLNAEADAVPAARAAGQSLWGSELPPLVLQGAGVMKLEPAVCGVMRAVCSMWCSILDALLPGLVPRGSAAVKKGKLGWYQSVTTVDLTGCEEEEDVPGVLAELKSIPSLRWLKLPSSCAERAVDAEAVCGLTTLTTLHLRERRELNEDDEPVEEASEWVLDLSTLPSLTTHHSQPR
jgi:hypothetical protein